MYSGILRVPYMIGISVDHTTITTTVSYQTWIFHPKHDLLFCPSTIGDSCYYYFTACFWGLVNCRFLYGGSVYCTVLYDILCVHVVVLYFIGMICIVMIPVCSTCTNKLSAAVAGLV
ncbi:hypothetical protein HOY80DRAFT_945499 [Tuber brumale]|nr:hypothetical protein HOY80DRAFT_945499 [Tuber brumale]